MDYLVNVLRTQPRFLVLVEAVALAVIIAFFDYVTPNELSVWPFYSVPILLVTWLGDRKLTVIFAMISTLAWWLVDRATGHFYPNEWLRVWDGLVRLMFFFLVIFAGWTVIRQRKAFRARLELLERSQQLEKEIIGISEREQQRIGRDLHDSVCQYLAAIGFTASMLKRQLEKESNSLSGMAAEIANLLQNASRLTRDLARGLSPVDRDEGGLEAALQELAESTSKIAGIPCSFVCTEAAVVFDNEKAIHLFRIAQEALGNALKHSQAKSVTIALENDGDMCSLRISDDGVGFIPKTGERQGMGLSIMQYRARMISGDLEIRANQPTGTVVSCTIGESKRNLA